MFRLHALLVTCCNNLWVFLVVALNVVVVVFN